MHDGVRPEARDHLVRLTEVGQVGGEGGGGVGGGARGPVHADDLVPRRGERGHDAAPEAPGAPGDKSSAHGCLSLLAVVGEPEDCNQLHQTVSVSGGNVKGSILII
ncbi:hypothetical protein GCM10010156_59360 [Planobispora rosea]|uniref:Uncharacterized protein n=1 Tax=Planobispora rosea TaxID=35762 RepID=A0A8J3WGT3_PLARO|nr:hypothetical protein GCM10010156_59360 [Planobispora rosea]GIH87166.1 hypothetical protein Pro02_55740 [Planobispora rosea]